MAPEQLSGEGVDGRSDLFSLGVILYALVTGHSPFHGDSATTVCFKVANREPIAASALDMTLPPQLDAVISRAMAKDPRERYQRGADFAEDLRILQQSYKPGSTTTSRRGVAATGTRSGTARTTTARSPAMTVASADVAVRNFLSKARIRDVILAAAAVVSLVIIAAQLKLFDNSPRVEPGSGVAANNLAEVNPGLANPGPANSSPANPGPANRGTAIPAQTAQPETVKPATASVATAKKSAAKTSPAPARQIVIPSSIIDLAVQHQFKDATLYVSVDDKPVLTLPLHGAAQKKLVVFNGVRGVMSQTLKIPAGKRVLRFRALSADQTVDLSKTLSADFIGGDTKSLLVSFDKHNSSIRLTWQ
jgi:serine/threonine-protein kinase